MARFGYSWILDVMKEKRQEIWDNLYVLASNMESHWMFGGDFNVIVSREEKLCGLPVMVEECEEFAFCINSCGLRNVGIKKNPYTWWNGRITKDCIFKRLD